MFFIFLSSSKETAEDLICTILHHSTLSDGRISAPTFGAKQLVSGISQYRILKSSLAQTGLPGVGEAVPQALAMAPQQAVEDTIKQSVQVETVYIRFPPDPLHC